MSYQPTNQPTNKFIINFLLQLRTFETFLKQFHFYFLSTIELIVKLKEENQLFLKNCNFILTHDLKLSFHDRLLINYWKENNENFRYCIVCN